MKITIIGSGAMGTLFAGLLSKSGNDVTILTINKKVEEIIKETGISISGISKITIPPSKFTVTSNPGEIQSPDLIIILVKSYDTLSTVPSIKKMMGKNTVTLTLQNGLGNYEALAKYIDNKRIIRGATSQSATLIKAGKVIHTGRGETVIEKNDISSQITAAFNKCGIKTVLNDNINSVIWSKLVLNCALNPVSAISKVKNGEVFNNKNLFEVAVETGKEVVAVADKLKIKILFPDVSKKIKDLCKATSNNTNSMLADVLAGKRTEINSLNGAILKIAGKLNVPIPVNTSLYSIVRKMEKQ